jgi:hypothetical protein
MRPEGPRAIDQIAGASQETKVSALTQQTSASAQQIAASAQELTNTAAELERLVAQHKVAASRALRQRRPLVLESGGMAAAHPSARA